MEVPLGPEGGAFERSGNVPEQGNALNSQEHALEDSEAQTSVNLVNEHYSTYQAGMGFFFFFD